MLFSLLYLSVYRTFLLTFSENPGNNQAACFWKALFQIRFRTYSAGQNPVRTGATVTRINEKSMAIIGIIILESIIRIYC